LNKGTSCVIYLFNTNTLNLETKVLNSKIDSTQKGVFLVHAVEDKQVFAYCTGTFWDTNDPRCKGEQRYRIRIPGNINKILDCTESKQGKGHLMHQAQGSFAKCTIHDMGDYLAFHANGEYPAGEEMTFFNKV